MSAEQINSLTELEANGFVYFYTPSCGTCAIAKSYLDIVKEIPEVPLILEQDINYAVSYAAEWKIESVPCLVKVKNGNVIEKLYAFEHVAKLYNFIRGDKNGSS